MTTVQGEGANPNLRARRAHGRARYLRGQAAEARAVAVLEADGWEIKARRVRTKAGEIDIIAEKAGLLAFVEVKARRAFGAAAEALLEKQRARLLAAAEIVLAQHPTWGGAGVRFDLIVVDEKGCVRRIRDAFRLS